MNILDLLAIFKTTMSFMAYLDLHSIYILTYLFKLVGFYLCQK